MEADAALPPGTAPAGPGTGDEPAAGPGAAGAGAAGSGTHDPERAEGHPRADGAGTADEAAGPEALAGSETVGAAEAAEEEGNGRFKVRLSNFEGPFDLLLQLISKHKLDVTEVALSRVTDEFMAYIRALGPDWDLDETTEFLVVAATLLDLKAARLLPAAEVEDEADLALLEARDLLFARLLQYRAYKRIAEIFGLRLDEEARRHPVPWGSNRTTPSCSPRSSSASARRGSPGSPSRRCSPGPSRRCTSTTSTRRWSVCRSRPGSWSRG